jgi:hypothetical protein
MAKSQRVASSVQQVGSLSRIVIPAKVHYCPGKIKDVTIYPLSSPRRTENRSCVSSTSTIHGGRGLGSSISREFPMDPGLRRDDVEVESASTSKRNEFKKCSVSAVRRKLSPDNSARRWE